MSIRIVRDYYKNIDRNDLESVLAIFAEDASYNRAGLLYEGKDQLRELFSTERKIRGVHRLDSVVRGRDGTIVAVGSFEGVGAQGDRREVRFADVWRFGREPLVSHRDTFLARGGEYVLA